MTYNYGATAPAPQAQEREPKKAVVFTGRISRDIVVNTTQKGQQVTNINIAIDQIKGETQWAQATFWGTDAQLAADFLAKGDTLSASGLMYMKSYQKNDGTQGSQLQFDSCSLLLSAPKTMDLISRIVDAKLANLQPQVEQPAPTQVQATHQGAEQMIQQAVAQPNVEVVAPQDEPIIDITSEELPF